jgi:hypothetical protein
MKKNNYIKKPILHDDKENLLVEESTNESFNLSNM